MKKLEKVQNTVVKRVKLLRKSSTEQIKKRPITSFVVILAIVFIFIVIGNFIHKPKVETTEQKPAIKSVQVYKIGSAPKIQLQGKVEKTGIIQIVAQTSGIVTNVAVQPGASITRGQTLVSLSSNYNGANAPALQAAMSKKQNDLVNDTYQNQKDIIEKQKEIADKTDSNNDQLRDINQKSIDETQSLLSLNQDILNQLDQNIQQASSSAEQFPLKELKSQFLSATNQIQSQLRQLEYQTNTDNPPSQLSDLQRDITMKQLDIQSKTLDLNKEISNIQLQLAYITASLMNPSTPVTGIVQRVYVEYGQSVNPGTPIALVSQTEADPTILVQVPRETAEKISKIENSVIHMGTITFETTPSYISTEATDGQLYTAYFPIPDNYASYVTDNSQIIVDVPIGYADTGKTVSFIPLDAIFQTQDGASINVIEKNKAVSRSIQLGQVYGSYVQVESGLHDGDQVILNRNIVEGDRITIQ